MIDIIFHDKTGVTPYNPGQTGGFENAAGSGEIHYYRLFDGVGIMLLRLEMETYTEIRTQIGMIEINFCINGRFETSFSMRDSVLLKPGDMAVSCYDGRHGTRSESRFPLGCYEGLCLEVDPAAAQNWLEKNAPGFSVDFAVLKQNLLGNRWFMFGTAGPRCEHVFRELYENAPYMDLRFLRLKVVELLMLLSRIPQEEGTDLYCSTEQTELAHHLRDHLLTNREGVCLPCAAGRRTRDLGFAPAKNVQTGLRCASIPLYQGIPSGTGCRRACPERKAHYADRTECRI